MAGKGAPSEGACPRRPHHALPLTVVQKSANVTAPTCDMLGCRTHDTSVPRPHVAKNPAAMMPYSVEKGASGSSQKSYSDRKHSGRSSCRGRSAMSLPMKYACSGQAERSALQGARVGRGAHTKGLMPLKTSRRKLVHSAPNVRRLAEGGAVGS